MSRPRPNPTVYLDSDDDDDDDIQVVSTTPSGARSMPPLPSGPRSATRTRATPTATVSPIPTPTPPAPAPAATNSIRRSTPTLPSAPAATPTAARSSRSRPRTPPTTHRDTTSRRVVMLDDDDEEPRQSERPSLAQRERERQMQLQQQQHRAPVSVPAAFSGPIILDDSQPLEAPPPRLASGQQTRRRSERGKSRSATPPAMDAVVSGPIVLDDSQPLEAREQEPRQRDAKRRSRRSTVEPATFTPGSNNVSQTPDQTSNRPATRRQRGKRRPVNPPIVIDPLFSQDMTTRNETQHLHIFPSSSPTVGPTRRRLQANVPLPDPAFDQVQRDQQLNPQHRPLSPARPQSVQETQPMPPVTPHSHSSTVIPPSSSPTRPPIPEARPITTPASATACSSASKIASNIVRLNRPNPFTSLPPSAFAPCTYCKQRIPAAAQVEHQALCDKRPQPKLKKAPSLPKGQRTLFDMVPGASPKGDGTASDAGGEAKTVTPGSTGGKSRVRLTPGSTGGKPAARCRPKVATVVQSARPSPSSVASSLLASPRAEARAHSLMQCLPMSPSRPIHPSSHAMRVPPPGPLPTPSLSGNSLTTNASELGPARWVSGTQWMDDTDDNLFADLGDGFTQQALAIDSQRFAPPPAMPMPLPAAKSSALPSPPMPAKPVLASVGEDSQGFAFDDEDPAVAAKANVLNALGIQEEKQDPDPMVQLSGSTGSPPTLDLPATSQAHVPAPPMTQPDPLPLRKSSTARRPVIASSDSSSDADENDAPIPMGRLRRGKKRPSEAQGGRLTPPKQPPVPASVTQVQVGEGHASLTGPWVPPPLPTVSHHQNPQSLSTHEHPHNPQPQHHRNQPWLPPLPPPLPPPAAHALPGQSSYQARPLGTPDDPLMQRLRSQFGGGYGHMLHAGASTGAGDMTHQQQQPRTTAEATVGGGSHSQAVAVTGRNGARGRGGRGRGVRAGNAAGARFGSM
ncbi:hypothetical protein BCR44DRAFT_1449312 [Catenaria anguillulae PL171]|uniref:Uncharacterized protein n=1 Tax=Catenaria anguillulae PL171 TaxID=765915 RepID=A0A1Y2H4X3_9FUNG|nr:hypothetical protein BCR44DRAFT_1449312 [Catenaria anguillulae PL171]